MKLKLPSLQQISVKALETIQRFPFAIVSAILGTSGAIWLTDLSGVQFSEYNWLVKFIWVSALSISLFVALRTIGESRAWSRPRAILVSSGAVLLLGLYYFLLPDEFEPSGSEAFYRYMLFFLSSHLLVSFGPYLANGEVHAFWAYNKTLFLGILRSALYSAVLFLGLSVAMLSLDNLLEFEIRDIRYGQLWIFLVGIFNTWFFLSGIPQPANLSPREKAYPEGLKVFVQYVLIPLVVIYICILYLYTGKILIEWQWPNGWVANLVLGFSIVGILSLLLLHPIKDKEDNKWIHLFSKGYYITLIPLIVLLLLSIWVRISEYGVTVNRYLVATLAVWLTGQVAYFLISKSKNIKMIPVSLCVVSLLVSFGPFGAFEVSKKSQLDRIEFLLTKHNLLSENGKVKQATEEIPFDDRKQMSSGISYLLTQEGAETLQPFFEQDLNAVLSSKDSMNVVSDAKAITMLIGIDYVYEWERNESGVYDTPGFYYQLGKPSSVSIVGYDHYIGEFNLFDATEVIELMVSNRSFVITYDQQRVEIQIRENDSGRALIFDVKSLLEVLNMTGPKIEYQMQAEDMSIEHKNEGLQAKIVFDTLNGQKMDNEYKDISAIFGVYITIEP